jgi:hypothetical protein
MGKNVLALILALSLGSALIEADDTKPIIKLMPFSSQGMSIEEARFIESLIQSYITDIGEVILYFDTSISAFSPGGSEIPPESPLEEPYTIGLDYARPPDYILSGSINIDQDNRILALDIQKTRTGEISRYVSVHKTTSELALKARSVVETAFALPAPENNPQEERAEPVSEARLLGTWRGDAGIELVRMQRGGNGLAILSSGAQMNLKYSIEGSVVRIIQSGPNTERFYHPLPLAVARQLAAVAAPMAWVFSLYDEGTALRGIKTATSVKYEGNTIVEFLPNTVREAEWIKSSR